MDTQIRRLLPRQVVDWAGAYCVEEDPGSIWGDCRIIDISSGGAGLEIPFPHREAQVGETVLLTIQLRGEIRDARMRGENRLRVGIEFTDVSERERAYLESLADLQVRW
jgi:hypothetical protein